MVRKRAVSPEEQQQVTSRLPLLYSTLSPVTAEQHGALFVAENRDFGFASQANAIPLVADEFAAAMRDYPIVIADGAQPMPVALVGFAKGQNTHVDGDGNWSSGHYVPAYLRRHPFMLLRESETADRNILCADFSSTIFQTAGEADQRLFGPNGETSKLLTNTLDFSNRYQTSFERTTALMAEAQTKGLIHPSEVTVSRGEQKAKIEGFSIISEEKLRALPDAELADMSRRGVLALFTTMQLSLSNFTDFGAQ